MRKKNDLRIAVIGGGAAGVAMAHELRKSGYTNFTVFEKGDDIGGTWNNNDYPGCEVDIHSYFYSFSFMPWTWTRTHARQPEIKAHIKAAVDKFDLERHFRLQTGVRSATWDNERTLWHVVLDSGEAEDFDVVVSGVGFLSDPRFPSWKGLDTFAGTAFHTAYWPQDVDLSGKRVALVGTGSTASQAVAAIAPEVEHLYVFQREPGWVIPKGERDYTPEELARFRRSVLRRKLERLRQFYRVSKLVRGMWVEGTKLNTRLREMALAHIEESIDDEATRAAVTPDFAFGCKRTIQAGTFYPALNRPNVSLVPHAVVDVNSTSVITDEGSYDADVLILSTGFKAQEYLSTVDVFGADGREIKSVWDGTAQAFVGMTVPGYPNFFMQYGPNTNGGGSIIFNLERQAEVVRRALGRIRRTNRAVDTTERAYERYTAWIDKRANSMLTAQRQCHNYYYSPTGRNVTQWPGSHALYSLVTKFWPLVGFTRFVAPPVAAAKPDAPVPTTSGVAA